MNRLISFAITGIMVISMGSNCFAAQKEIETGNSKEITIEKNDEEYSVVDEQAVSDGYSRASWGQGYLHCSNPVFSNPSGYAETKTYSGTAYSMYTRLQLIDSDSISYLTAKAELKNASSVNSATLLSPTKKCSFHGSHGIQDTSSSGWQTANTQQYY